MIKDFIELCKMSQENLKEYVTTELRKTHTDVKSKDGFVFAKGDFPVLLVAHLDTVHKELPNNFMYDTQALTISSPNGIGGDDRCGVYMILEVIKQYNCSVLFCEDEEIGTVGAEKFISSKLSKGLEFNYIIEFDRMGRNDAVFYDCDNPEFEEFITKEFFKTAHGSFTDISEIAPALGCAAVNLSCGYYKAHTTDEYVVYPEMLESIDEACKILERTTDEDKFEYIESADRFSLRYDDAFYGYEQYFLIQYVDERGHEDWFETEAISLEEAVGMFCIRYPHLSFSNIVDLHQDNFM